MGRLFISNCGGNTVFVCGFCHTYLSNYEELRSADFRGSTGKAILMDRVWNIEVNEVEIRSMTTGRHLVRDVMCTVCKSKLGWMYEFAFEESQRYKEAKVILECALIHEIPGMPDPLNQNKFAEQSEITYESPQYSNDKRDESHAR